MLLSRGAILFSIYSMVVYSMAGLAYMVVAWIVWLMVNCSVGFTYMVVGLVYGHSMGGWPMVVAWIVLYTI